MLAATGNLILRFREREKVKIYILSRSNFICSLAQDECNGSREDVVEAMLVVMREEEMLKTRY